MITAAKINAKMPAFSLLFRRSGFVSLDNAVFVFDQDGLTAEAEFYANDGPTILIFNQEVFSIKARLNNAGLSLSSLLWICASTLTSFGVNQDCLFTKAEFNEKTADRLYDDDIITLVAVLDSPFWQFERLVRDTEIVVDNAKEFIIAFNSESEAQTVA